MVNKLCIECGAAFTAKISSAKYCSAACKDKYNLKKNPDAAKARRKRSYNKHRDERIANHRLWVAANPDYQKKALQQKPLR